MEAALLAVVVALAVRELVAVAGIVVAERLAQVVVSADQRPAALAVECQHPQGELEPVVVGLDPCVLFTTHLK